MAEFYVMQMKGATGAYKYLVIRVENTGTLIVYERFDVEQMALNHASYLNDECG